MWTGWVCWYFCVCVYGCMYVWVGGCVLNCFALLCGAVRGGAVWCGACVRARARVCVRVCNRSRSQLVREQLKASAGRVIKFCVPGE